MKLDFLKPLSNFQYSVNLEYDINDDNKIQSYIPTSGSLSIIEEVVESVLSREGKISRARLLTGAYGKGKSHLTLTLMSLLSGKDKKLFKRLFEKAKVERPELYANLNLLFSKKSKLFPVVIKTTSNDLKTNLLNSMHSALLSNGYEDLMPNTFFDSAIDTILSWKNNYTETYNSFVKQARCSGEKFIEELKQYNIEKYEFFASVYPLLTSGSVFNPMLGTDVVKLFEDIINELKPYGYQGLFVVYDEFGKFLEGSLDTKTTASDLKLLQDLAERCDRSKADNQLHLLLISHKGIDNYVSQLSKEKVDNWKGIAGRFSKMSIQSNDTEVYEMISSVLKKDKERFRKFARENKVKFDELTAVLEMDKKVGARSGAFNEVIELIGESFVEDCYPLHPYSLLMLPKVSELVAQNERSIFTYLSSNDKHSVNYFNKRNIQAFPIIEPDLIYDYFEAQFKGEPFGSEIRNQWQTASSAIAKLNAEGNDLAIKLVKTLSLIYIINQFEILPPSIVLLSEIYALAGNRELQVAFEILRKEELLIELEFRPYVKVRNSSNNNLNDLIADETAKSARMFDVKQALLDNMSSKYFYPTQYNDRLEITRYFEFKFITLAELLRIEDMSEYISKESADGFLFAVLLNDEFEKEQAEAKAVSLAHNRAIVVLPKKPKLINEYLKKYVAINNLMESKKTDSVLVEELYYIQQDLKELIQDYIKTMYLRPEQGHIDYYYNGENREIKRRKALSSLLSEICEKIYENTPKIVNENINRNNISSTMKSTRKKVIEKVIQTNIEPKFGLVSSQDINVVRSVYLVTGIIDNLDNIRLNYKNCSDKVQNILDIIDGFVLSARSERVSFIKLYDKLTLPSNGIGLKKGIIPFFVAVIIKKYKEQLVVYYRNKEVELTADLLINIFDKPDAYQLKIEQFEESQEVYLSSLQSMFLTFAKESDKEFSRFDYVARAMQRWYYSLAKFDRETKYYTDASFSRIPHSRFALKMKSILGNPEINPREFLFENLPKFAQTGNLQELATCVEETKKNIDSNLKNITSGVSHYIKKHLKAKKESSLYSVLNDYSDKLNERTKNKAFSGSGHYLLELMRNVDQDEDKSIRKFIRALFSLRIEDFNDKLYEGILPAVEEAFKEIKEFDSKVTTSQSEKNTYSLVISDDDGKKRELNFDDMDELSYNGKFLYNELNTMFEEYDDSLSSAEKSQILLKLIKELYK